MIQKLKLALISLASLFMFSAPLVAGGVAAAPVDSQITAGVCQGADKLSIDPVTGTSCSVQGGDTDSVNKLLTKIINWISVIVGIVAVIMIIVGGFRYITSGGTPEKVTGAKNTILYGLIGLIIVALAQVIVRFVLKQVTVES